MSKIKEFIQSPDKRQHLKTIVIAMSILIATFSATLLTNWITSLKSASDPPEPPGIYFERRDDLLRARSNQVIEAWQYAGPRRQSICNETIFTDILVFGKTFEEGNRVRLDFDRDNNRYYCFKAIDQNGIAGFASYSVTDLDRPIIVFKQTSDKLTASLDPQTEANIYTSDWQHVLLGNSTEECSEKAFLDQASIFSSNEIVLGIIEQDLHYCFRLMAKNGDYIYQIRTVTDDKNTAAQINVLKSGNKLYLSSTQTIKNWVVAVLDETENCESENFKDAQNYRLSSNQITIINLHLETRQAEDYCIRAQNKIGLYSYKKYILDEEPLINIKTSFTSARSRLVLTAESFSSVSGWQVAHLGSINDCQVDRFSGQNIVAYQRQIEVAYPSNRSQIYCWQATSGQNKTYAVHLVPAADKMIATYRIGNQIKAYSLGAQLSNWQYISRDNQRNESGSLDHCDDLDFSNNTAIANGQMITFGQVKQYCFRAVNQAGVNHHSRWFTADLYLNESQAGENAVVLANDLKLTDLGKFIFYSTKPKFHEDLSDLQSSCNLKTAFSCYSFEDRRIHILKSSETTKDLDELRTSITQAVRWHYLTDQQRIVQDFELAILYQDNQAFFDEVLPKNFYIDKFYEGEFLDGFYNFLMTQATDGINLRDWQESWQYYHQSFFNPKTDD